MAKIPSYSPQVRLQDKPNTMVDTNAARAGGEKLVLASNVVTGIAKSVDKYQEIQDQIKEKSDSVKLLSYKEKYEKLGIESELAAKTANGDSLKAFDMAYNEGIKDIDNIQDRGFRAKAKRIAFEVSNNYKKRLIPHEVVRRNNELYAKGEEVLNDITFRVQNDPSQLADALSSIDSLTASLPLENKDGKNFAHVAKKDVITAALDSHVANGNYEGAIQALNTTEAGTFFSREERQKLTDSIRKRKFNVLNEKYKIETMEFNAMKRERQETQDKNGAALFDNLFSAQTEAEKVAVVTKAQDMLTQQLIDRPTYNALLTNQEKISAKQSDDLRAEYLVKFYKGTDINTLKKDITKEMESGRMSHRDGFGLINNMLTQSKKAQSDPEYAKQSKLAQEYIRASVPMSAKGFMGTAMHGQNDKQMIVEINNEMAKFEKAGHSPMEAARLAKAKVIGLSSLATSINMKTNLINNDPKKLEEYAKELAKKYHEAKKSGTLTKPTEIKLIRDLEEAKMRIEALKYRQEYDELTRVLVPSKEGSK